MMNCGGEPFALTVLGDSMIPEFVEGHVIIIDPDGIVKNGSFVLAVYQEEYIFRQLVIVNEKYFLKPLNHLYPTLEISGLDAVKGVIIQRAGRRRKELKHY
jgi:DNA polymerase V